MGPSRISLRSPIISHYIINLLRNLGWEILKLVGYLTSYRSAWLGIRRSVGLRVSFSTTTGWKWYQIITRIWVDLSWESTNEPTKWNAAPPQRAETTPTLISLVTAGSVTMHRRARLHCLKRKRIKRARKKREEDQGPAMGLRKRRKRWLVDYMIIIFKITIIYGVNLVLGLASCDLLSCIRVHKGLFPFVLQRLYHSEKRRRCLNAKIRAKTGKWRKIYCSRRSWWKRSENSQSRVMITCGGICSQN